MKNGPNGRSPYRGTAAELPSAIRSDSRFYVFPFDDPGACKSIQAFPQLGGVLLSPDGRWVLGTSWPLARAQIWDAQSGELAKSSLQVSASFRFSPDGRRLVYGNERGGQILTADTWESVAKIPPYQSNRSVVLPTYSPDSRLLAIVRDGHVIALLDAETLQEIAQLQAQIHRGIAQMAFSADGGMLATTSTTHVVQLWDLSKIRKRLADLGVDWK